MRGVVKHLSLKSYLTFIVHFLVATLLRALYVLASKLPFQSDVAGTITKRKPAALQRKTISQMMYTGLIKIVPDFIIHAYLKFESRSSNGIGLFSNISISRPRACRCALDAVVSI